MIVGDIDGNLLTLKSSSYEEGLINGTIDQVSISLSYNKGTTVTKTIAVPAIKTWTAASLLISSDVIINKVYMKNIFTGQILDILLTPMVMHNSQSVANLERRLNNNLTLLDKDILAVCTVTGDVFDIVVSYLPAALVMYSVEYETSGITIINYFTLAPETGVTLGDDTIYIDPSFFGLTSFVEGIYEPVLLIHVATGFLVQETGCYFLDLTMKCRLNLVTDLDCSQNKEYFDYLMLHYSLVQASNCNCNCEQMHNIYTFLSRQLPLNSNTQDCGCN